MEKGYGKVLIDKVKEQLVDTAEIIESLCEMYYLAGADALYVKLRKSIKKSGLKNKKKILEELDNVMN